MTNHPSHLLACPSCDLLVEIPPLNAGHSISCPRCATTIIKKKENSITNVLLISLSALFIAYPAFFWPIMTLNAVGNEAKGSLFDAALACFSSNYQFVAFMVLLTSVLLPVLRFSILFLISFCLKIKYHPPELIPLFKFSHHLEEWAMLDIYIIGIGVTLIKVYALASIEFNVALFCLLALTVLSVLLSAKTDQEEFWQALTGKSQFNENLNINRTEGLTAKQAGLLSCHHCKRLIKAVPVAENEEQLCSRCASPMHYRKHNALTNTWALLISAVIFFIPANVLPIMKVYFLGTPDESTIMDGIIYFFHHGSYGIGLIIFSASVLVPVFKMLGLGILLLTVQLKQFSGLKKKTKMYLFIEFVGRWSMLDIFVIALMAILVNFGNFTSIFPSTASTYFCTVVILTMLAATTFDSRLLWDTLDQNNEKGSFK
jgi:paraquat-inducible protein A